MKLSAKESVQLLVKIGEIDLKIADCTERLDAVIQLKAERQKTADDAGAAKAKMEANHEALLVEKRGLESDITEWSDAIRDKEARLYSIKTNKEYQASLKETADLKGKVRVAEDRVLALDEKISALSAELTQLSTEMTDKTSELESRMATLSQEELDLRHQAEVLSQERQALTVQLDTPLLRHYDRIHGMHAMAIVPVRDGVCTGCDMKISPRLVIDVRRQETIVSCTNCGRLLMMPTTDETPASN